MSTKIAPAFANNNVNALINIHRENLKFNKVHHKIERIQRRLKKFPYWLSLIRHGL